jgi:predicted ATPase
VLQAVTVSNYRSLGENVRVTFGRFTALVGPNGSGKSNLVDALRFVSDAMHMGLPGAITHRNGIKAVRRWSAGHPWNLSMKLEFALDAGPATYAFELTGKPDEYEVKFEDAEVWTGSECNRLRVEYGRWLEGPTGLRPLSDKQNLVLPLVGGDTRFQPLMSALHDLAIYAIFPDTLKRPQTYSPARPMDRHGSNWVSILKDQQSAIEPELVAALQKLTGDIEALRVAQFATYLVVQFRHASTSGGKAGKWFDTTQESDGTLRVAGIVTALLQTPPLPFIGIEEPELTIHPGALPLVYDFLAQASSRSQVIVTTHSPELLDLVDADDVRVVLRKDGVTTVAPMEEHQKSAVKSGLQSLGEVLRAEGIHQQLPLDFAGL